MTECMDDKKQTRRISHCLECGDKISYGRKDKKFCCQECKTRYFNNLSKNSRVYKRKVMSCLDKNYEILYDLVKSGVESIDIVDIVSLGFHPGIMTSHIKCRGKEECACFDIKYYMSPTRVYSISKIENIYLTLRYIGNINQNNRYE